MILRKILKKIRQIELRMNRLMNSLRVDPLRAALLLLAPGFSPVSGVVERFNRFSGFPPARKPLKRLALQRRPHTGLKPGANETLDLYCPGSIAARYTPQSPTTFCHASGVKNSQP